MHLSVGPWDFSTTKAPVFLLPLWLQYLHNVSNVTTVRILDLKNKLTLPLQVCKWAKSVRSAEMSSLPSLSFRQQTAALSVDVALRSMVFVLH